ncbi:hypothetical protein G9464_14005 [Halostella sp. JP-L12]|uniref:STT3 domain-containing protein n=1 Tax=Halostella TaxID=1843185 RepID=UPI000EF8207D|nr:MULTISPECIES: STT3 domain-containing protein [Halostella]NHN48699.1 hypothetical protein [Halostella sp. JP-L12]
MSRSREEIAALLTDRPEFEPALRAILAANERRETWTFDDVDVDSGTFGELVSRGVVESAGDEYRLADPDAVRAALDGDARDPSGGGADDGAGFAAGLGDRTGLAGSSFGRALPTVSRDAAVGLVAALALVALFRLIAYASVFRNGDVVLLANDPYFYRHWLLVLAERSADAFAVPDGIREGEPLLVAVLWTAARTVGADARAVDLVLAWYPVAAALGTGLAVYGTAKRLTSDARVGIAAVGILAVTPVHAYRSAVGFGDHHAFDYLLVGVALYALVGAAAVDRELSGRELATAAGPWALLLGASVAAQVLAWNAGPLLVLPVGLYAVGRALADVRAGRSPLRGLAPTVVGVGLAAALVAAAHESWGWQADYVALTPALLLAGVVAAALVAEGAHRAGISWKIGGGGLLAAAGAVFAVAWTQFPDFRAEFRQEVERLATKPGQSDITETASLFDPDLGGPLAPIFYFGFALFLALPYVAWGLWAAASRDRFDWLAACSYAAVLVVLGGMQVRFAGALAVVVAVFAGLGFVHLASVVDLARRPAVFGESEETTSGSSSRGSSGSSRKSTGSPRESTERSFRLDLPDNRSLGLLVALAVLVAGLGAVLTPPLTDDLTVEEESYRAASWIQDDVDDRGLAEDRRYVFSRWDRNRMYNAFASGNSLSYGYARSSYDGFLAGTNETAWYQRLDRRGEYVVTGDRETDGALRDASLYNRLHDNYGADAAHFRAVYATDDGSRKVFTLVPGATITGEAGSNETVTATTEVDIGGTTVTYERTASVENGTYAVTVAQPGEYSVGNDTVRVSEEDVRNGTTVELHR